MKIGGLAENARAENDGLSESRDVKMQDMKMQDTKMMDVIKKVGETNHSRVRDVK